MLKYLLLFITWPYESLRAQTLQLNTSVGFYTGSVLKGTNGRFFISSGPVLAASFSYNVKSPKQYKDVYFEFQYSHVSSQMRFEKYNTNRTVGMGDMRISTYLLGAGKKFGNRSIQPYGAALMGATYFSPQGLENAERLTFTFSFATGAKIAVSPVIGFLLHAQALLPLMYNRVYVSWERDIGITNSVAPIGIMFSGYFTGGIYYNLVP
jgi:hypothetical protein